MTLKMLFKPVYVIKENKVDFLESHYDSCQEFILSVFYYLESYKLRKIYIVYCFRLKLFPLWHTYTFLKQYNAKIPNKFIFSSKRK